MATGGAECKSVLQREDHAAFGKVAQNKSTAIAERYLAVSRHEVRQSQAGKRSSEAMNM